MSVIPPFLVDPMSAIDWAVGYTTTSMSPLPTDDDLDASPIIGFYQDSITSPQKFPPAVHTPLRHQATPGLPVGILFRGLPQPVQSLRLSPPPVLPSLIALLKVEPTASIGTKANELTVGLLCKLLESQDYGAVVSKLTVASDVELLIDFILCLLDNNHLLNYALPDANRKARRLMFKLLARAPVTPTSLFLTGVTAELNPCLSVAMGGFGCVFKGKYQGIDIALKVLYKKCRGSDSIAKDFCREALAWRSLSHPYILPLLGIYEAESQLFLVSPYMKNGTLASWRKNKRQSVREIRQRILGVAEGVQYIHSEGIVHGDLRGENILLDACFRSQITDFGLTKHSDVTITSSDTAWTLSFAAPELFGACNQCGQRECYGCTYYGTQKRRKTLQTDVYAFGCLYYEIFFDAMPFANMEEYQVIVRVMNGERPRRLVQPWMGDPEWNIIQRCWVPNSFGRPDMNYIVDAMWKNPGGDVSRTVPSTVTAPDMPICLHWLAEN